MTPAPRRLRGIRTRMVALLACGLAGIVAAASYEERRAAALALDEKHDPAAEAALKAVLEEFPSDGLVTFRYAYNLLLRASSLPEGPTRKQLLKEARSYFQKAKDLKVNQPVIDRILAAVGKDGSESEQQFSGNAEANALMKRATQAFSAHEFDKAASLYQEILHHLPGDYMATLYVGDSYFGAKNFAAACEWFAKAVAIDPDRETAHRYWADALQKQGKDAEAEAHYVEAIVADPYNRMTWHALTTYGQAAGLDVRFRGSPLPGGQVRPGENGGKPTITLPKEFGTLSVLYTGIRAKWIDENRARVAPEGKPYRQTLEEEVFALGSLLSVVGDVKAGPPKSDREVVLHATALQELQEIAAAGLLEPYVLFQRANAEIAQDYGPYRAGHRSQLVAYLKRFYLGKG